MFVAYCSDKFNSTEKGPAQLILSLYHIPIVIYSYILLFLFPAKSTVSGQVLAYCCKSILTIPSENVHPAHVSPDRNYLASTLDGNNESLLWENCRNLSECAISTIGSWIWTDPELIAISYMPEICRWLKGKFRGGHLLHPVPADNLLALPVTLSQIELSQFHHLGTGPECIPTRATRDVPVDHAPRAAIPYQGAGIPSHTDTLPSACQLPFLAFEAARILSQRNS